MTRRYWRTGELRILREHYGSGGVAACAPLLPGRSPTAIYAQALRLGLRRRGPRPPLHPHCRNGRRGILTDAQRAELAAIVASPVPVARVHELARRWGVTVPGARARIVRAGGGVAAVRERWTRAQDALLREHCDLPPERIVRLLRAQGAHRTPWAVYMRLQRNGLAGCADRAGYTALELSRLLGVGKTWAWRRLCAGDLRAVRRPHLIARADRPAARGAWLIPPGAVRTYLRAHPDVLARVRKTADRTWLADLLGELRVPGPDTAGRPVEGLAEYHLEAA